MTGLLVFRIAIQQRKKLILSVTRGQAIARCQRILIPHFGDQSICLAARFSKAFHTAALDMWLSSSSK
jgi:hypothetical protein